MHNVSRWINRNIINDTVDWGLQLAETPLGKGSIVVSTMAFGMSLLDKPTYHGVKPDDLPRAHRPSFRPGLPGDPYLNSVQKMFDGRTGHHNIGNARFI